METLGNNLLTKSCLKVAQKFNCFYCDYFTDKKSSYDKHLLTSKHHTLTNVNILATNSCSKINEPIFTCKYCKKYFKSRVGLWKHNKLCNSSIINPITNEKDDIIMILIKQNTDLIKEQSNLIKEQSDIKNIILEIVKNGTNNEINNNTTHINSHNKAFNLNFFLNETCKNAMNIADFVVSIKLELSDLMELGEIGYVESMSKIITKNLNALDETIRPIHCTDKKREIFYIKDEDKWEKEDEYKKRLRKIILKISNKSLKLLPKYREKYPDYNNAESINSDEHCKIVIEAVICDKVKDEKIIRNISRVTIISKENSLCL